MLNCKKTRNIILKCLRLYHILQDERRRRRSSRGVHSEVINTVASKTAPTFSVYAFFVIILTAEKRVEKSVGGGEGRKNGRSRRCRSVAATVAAGRRRDRRLLVARHASGRARFAPRRRRRDFAFSASSPPP